MLFCLDFVSMDTEGSHQRVAEHLLTEVPARHWLHSKDGDALFFITNLTECLAYLIIYIVVFCIWYHHHALDILLFKDKCQSITEILFSDLGRNSPFRSLLSDV